MEPNSKIEVPGEPSVSVEEGSIQNPAKQALGEDGSADGEDQDGQEEEEEDEGECGFCLFMKSGPCKESFIQWEECVEQAENAKEDVVLKCHQVTLLLKQCMDNNPDYYEPVLRAEREMSEQTEGADSEEVKLEQTEKEGRIKLQTEQTDAQNSPETPDKEKTTEQPTDP